jgi:hypothetical protein
MKDYARRPWEALWKKHEFGGVGRMTTHAPRWGSARVSGKHEVEQLGLLNWQAIETWAARIAQDLG